MRLFTLFLASFLLLANAPTETNASTEPVFVYQRIHSLVQHHDNRITLRVWDDGRMEMRFPAYTPRAGHYQGHLESSGMTELDRMVSMLANIRPAELTDRLNLARSTSLVEIADADMVRFSHRGASREKFELVLPAPDAWSSVIPQVSELAILDELERDLRGWMDRQIQRMERQP